MEKLKIVVLTHQLSEKDKENVSFYLKSPSLTHKKEYHLLFDCILHHKENCNKKLLWNSVYPKHKLDEQKFRKLCFERIGRSNETNRVGRTNAAYRIGKCNGIKERVF